MNAENVFLLQPSEIPEAGVGCFAISGLRENMRLNSSGEDGNFRRLAEAEIDDAYLKYCPLLESGLYLAPPSFTMMAVYWYINHAKEPNTEVIEGKIYASRDVEPGEELTMYYPDLLTHPKNLLWVRAEHI